MKTFYPTIVIRHRRENLKKCSLRGLEKRKDFAFYPYPIRELPSLGNYILLTATAPLVLTEADGDRGLLLIDGTWKLSEKMLQVLSLPSSVERRSLPHWIETAYPRRQDEPRGLASIEALYAAFLLTGRNPKGLLDGYYWRELFLEKNRFPIVG